MTAENESLQGTVDRQSEEIERLKAEVADKDRDISQLNKRLELPQIFSVELVLEREKTLKNLFKYYTGLTYLRFCALLSFLIPQGYALKYICKRADLQKINNKNALFFTLCRLRHGFGLKDLATRFGISLQSSGELFNVWLDHAYCKLGKLSIWPHRDNIIKDMPSEYRKEFPTSLIIIDGTEVKTQSPSALGLQSQLYSDYKSNTTLKGLIGCDPNGDIMYVSELFTGSISDKALTMQSGFYDTIKQLKSIGYINNGDAIMVDKGFSIRQEIEELGLLLNIPPFATTGSQMSVGDSALTNKIARHRVHIERLICKVKTFKLLSNRIPTTLFHKANRIWSVCCWLTLFQDVFVQDKV